MNRSLGMVDVRGRMGRRTVWTWGLLLIAVGGLAIGVSLPGCSAMPLQPRPPAQYDPLRMMWSGAVTPTSARVNVRVPEDSAQVRLAVRSAAGDTWRYTPPQRARLAGDFILSFPLDDLSPGTRYTYALSIDGKLDTTQVGRFQTFRREPFSFRVAMSGCARTGSEHAVFDAIRAARPDLFLHLGDMHYENIAVNEVAAFRQAFRQVLASERQAALYRSVPIAYVWDDHDYGPNNSDRFSPSRASALATYREYVPHYPLAAAAPNEPIYQAFSMGRVRFILTDLRSARVPPGQADAGETTMMGAEQKAWFKEELRAARDRYPVIIWVSTVPWIGDSPTAEDRWAAFAEERADLATYMDTIGVADQMAILSGDAHMVALDDGSNNRYSTESDAPLFPVVHGAALDRRGSTKGGPYSEGSYPNQTTIFGQNDGQFTVMDVDDRNGDEVCVTWTGHRDPVGGGDLETLVQWSKCYPALEQHAAP